MPADGTAAHVTADHELDDKCGLRAESLVGTALALNLGVMSHKSFCLLRVGQTEAALKSGGTVPGVPVATGLVWAVAAFAFSVWHGLDSLC